MKWSLDALTGKTEDHLIQWEGRLIHPEIKSDFCALKNAAQNEGFSLTIASSFRDFDRQMLIWNNKFLGSRPVLDDNGHALDITQLSENEKISAILRWSALPGASRHHWGTDLDVYAKNHLPQKSALQLEPWEYLTGHQALFFQWLKENAPIFGFYFPYQNDNGGVAFEPWHISHKATASPLLEQLTQNQLKNVIRASDIAGKKTILTQLDWIYDRYICNVSKA